MMSPIVIPEVEGMSVIKVIEVVSTSPISWQDAVEEGIKEASRTIHNIVGVDIVSMKGHVHNNVISEYRTDLKIAYLVDKDR